MNLLRFLPNITPALSWVQVEVTSHCTNPDAMPRRLVQTVDGPLRKGVEWVERHMEPALFERLAPLISRADMVHLRGWGDPFLHPVFPELLRRSRALCRSVTTATCGEGVTEDQLKLLIALQIDGLTVAMAGMTEDDNQARRGTSLRAATRTVQTLRELRDHYASPAPGINILYTLTRQGLENGELERLPAWADKMGADGVILNTHSFVSREQDQHEVLVPEDQQEYDELQNRLHRVRDRAAELGLGWHHFMVNGGAPGNGCIEQPHRTTFVGSDGSVAPCVFSLLPVRCEPDALPGYWFQGRRFDYPLGSFGNAAHTSFRHVWAGQGYCDFRHQFERDQLPEHCSWCWRPYLVPA